MLDFFGEVHDVVFVAGVEHVIDLADSFDEEFFAFFEAVGEGVSK